MTNILDGYCRCGCGEITTIYRGKSRKFIAGHQARGENNSRFGIVVDSDLRKKISDVRKEQGTPWWEGRKHKSSSKKKMSDIRKIIFLGEGNPFYGKHHTEENKAIFRANTLKQRAQAVVLPSKPESQIHDELRILSIVFETEKLINNKFCVDVFVPQHNLVIYVDGCYWHACPIHFPGKRSPRGDNSRVPYLTKCGYNVEILWEHDIKTSAKELIENICRKYKIIVLTPTQ